MGERRWVADTGYLGEETISAGQLRQDRAPADPVVLRLRTPVTGPQGMESAEPFTSVEFDYDAARRKGPARDPAGLYRKKPAGEWVRRAACVGMKTSLFFPEKDVSVEVRETCARCEVRVDCLAWALDTGEKDGFLGGKSGRERRRMMRGLS